MARTLTLSTPGFDFEEALFDLDRLTDGLTQWLEAPGSVPVPANLAIVRYESRLLAKVAA